EAMFDVRVVRLDGGVSWVRNHLVPYLEEDGSTTFIGIVLDISGLKDAEETARVASHQLRMAVEHAGVVPYEYRLGNVVADPGGAEWTLVVHADDQAEFRRAHERAEADGDVVSVEFRHRHPDGRWHWALARASRVPAATPAERSWVSGVLLDTT